MIESITQFWYMWVVLLVLIVVAIFVCIKASKAVKRKNEIMAKQHEELKRYKMLVEKYKELNAQTAENADAKELAEGVTAALQYELEKSDNPDEAYENAEKWRREVYALFYFDEDVFTSLSFFFKNNGGPLPRVAVDGLVSIGDEKLHSLAASMFSMYDDKNENVSLDAGRADELDEKFRKVYNSEEFFEKVKLYILNAVR